MENLGGIQIIEQQAMTKLPQQAASAWSTVEGLTGASYKAIAYVGTQQVKGVNHIFIAEQTLVLANPVRHIVLIKVNAFNGNYNVVSIEQIV